MADQEIRALLDRRCWDQAFEMPVGEYQGRVFRLAYSIPGNRAWAEDAAQEPFLRVWRAIETYNGRAAVSTWLYAIARNTSLSLREYHARREMTALDAIAEPSAKAESGEPEGEQELEVAAILAVPVGTLKTHLHRARKLLGARIEERV